MDEARTTHLNIGCCCGHMHLHDYRPAACICCPVHGHGQQKARASTDDPARRRDVWSADSTPTVTQTIRPDGPQPTAQDGRTYCTNCGAVLENGSCLCAPQPTAQEAERVAQDFHETYERLAPLFGYETRKESAVPWSAVPEKNRKLMIAVAGEVGDRIYRRGFEEGKKWREDKSR